MAQLVVWDIISLDGSFEGNQPWDLRLHEHLWGEDLRQLSLQIGEEAELLVFGLAHMKAWPNTGRMTSPNLRSPRWSCARAIHSLRRPTVNAISCCSKHVWLGTAVPLLPSSTLN